MKKSKLIVLACIVMLGVIASSANAGVYTFQPTPTDLKDLDHHYYYAWKIDFALPSGETITHASLFFDDIRNWDNNPNKLYLSLLNGNDIVPNIPSTPVDVEEGWDNQIGGDNTLGFSGAVSLHTYYNLTTTPQDITYFFDSSEISTLNTYVLADNNFGIGFDPECHYWNEGITLTIETVPVPAAVILGILGLGVAGVKLRKYA